MPFYLHIPLPGPFSYGARIGGKKRRTSKPASDEYIAQVAANMAAGRCRKHAQYVTTPPPCVKCGTKPRSRWLPSWLI